MLVQLEPQFMKVQNAIARDQEIHIVAYSMLKAPEDIDLLPRTQANRLRAIMIALAADEDSPL